MINKDKLKRRFSRQATNYDQYANVQKFMGNKLIAMMNGKPVLNILEVGSGTGYVTYLLRKAFPNAQIMAVDIAEGMIKVARERIHDDSVTFICGDIESINLDGKFDLIISNATFQWFNEPRKTLEKLKNYLTSKGSLYFSTFGENTFSELHSCYEKTQIGNDANVKPGDRKSVV